MILTETIPAQLFDKRLAQIHHDIEGLNAIATQLKTKQQKLTQLFHQASSALNVVSQLTILVPQTSTEIRATLEAIFQQDKPENCPVSEVKSQTISHPLIQVAHQLLPLLKQGQPISNTAVSRLMAETFGGSDAEGNWLWKDVYEALEIAQILLIQQQGRELLNQSNRRTVLQEIEQIHRLCPTQTKRSEVSLQLQQFSTPLPLGYIAKVAANIEWRDSFVKLQNSAKVAFSCGIAGNAYAKHGTTIETRLTVFDKIAAENPGEFANCFDAALSLSDLLNYVEMFVPERQALTTTITTELKVRVIAESAPPTIAVSNVKAKQPQAKSEQKPTTQATATFEDAVELEYTTCDWKGNEREISDALYEAYEPQTIIIEGAVEHPSPLVQSAAMASVAPPQPSYQPYLPKRLVSESTLSAAQLESAIYAGESHSQFLKGDYQVDDTLDIVSVAPAGTPQAVRFRRGYFIGDSTGVGKGRQVSAILLDNWLQGRKQAIWLSKSQTLLEDARRDWAALGGSPDQIVPLSQFRQGEPIELAEGIIFATYATLWTEAKQGKPSRVEQLIDWCGKNFDGVIVFDEAHAMSNASPEKKERGIKKASLQGVAGLRLQHGLPQARVLYVSATGATTIANLAYAQRLGLWMAGEFPFASQADFVSEMEKGGIAALEVVSRDLKALGLYTARSLSSEGVEYDILEHELTQEQIEIYNAYADAFQIIHQNLEAALQATNITSPSGQVRNRNAKSAARSAFESNKQRFFNHLITSMKCPTLLKAIEQDLASGHAAVIQITSTPNPSSNPLCQNRTQAPGRSSQPLGSLRHGGALPG